LPKAADASETYFRTVAQAVLPATRKDQNANALKSTGPRTPEGKNISRLNGVRHRTRFRAAISARKRGA
jgi:hypothetical protein